MPLHNIYECYRGEKMKQEKRTENKEEGPCQIKTLYCRDVQAKA